MAKRDISHGNYESEILLVARRGSRNGSGSVRAEEYRSSHGWEAERERNVYIYFCEYYIA